MAVSALAAPVGLWKILRTLALSILVMNITSFLCLYHPPALAQKIIITPASVLWCMLRSFNKHDILWSGFYIWSWRDLLVDGLWQHWLSPDVIRSIRNLTTASCIYSVQCYGVRKVPSIQPRHGCSANLPWVAGQVTKTALAAHSTANSNTFIQSPNFTPQLIWKTSPLILIKITLAQRIAFLQMKLTLTVVESEINAILK